jgi:hypothetical protein
MQRMEEKWWLQEEEEKRLQKEEEEAKQFKEEEERLQKEKWRLQKEEEERLQKEEEEWWQMHPAADDGTDSDEESSYSSAISESPSAMNRLASLIDELD